MTKCVKHARGRGRKNNSIDTEENYKNYNIPFRLHEPFKVVQGS